MELNIINNETIACNSLFDSKYEIGVRMQDVGANIPKHYHDYVEIVCQIEGTSTQVIDQKLYELQTGEIIIINPSQAHENYATESTVLNIIISKKFLTNLVIESAFDDNVIKLKTILSEHIHTRPYAIDFQTMNTLKEILYHNQNPKAMYYLQQKSLLSCFLIDFANKTRFNTTVAKNDQLDLINYIQDNIKTASLNEYSRLCNYSTSLLSQKIKAEYNLTFIEILQDIRLKLAANILITSNRSVESVMVEVGYSNRTHFYTLFKNKYNYTPSQYKKINKI